MSYPSFVTGEVLTAADMNAVGLWLVKTQTVGSAVSTVTVTGAFSSSYDNYRIILSGGTQSGNGQIYIQLGSSTTGYYGSLIYNSTTSATPVGAANNNTARCDWIGGGFTANQCHASVDLFGPFLAQHTKVRNGQYQQDNGYGTYNGEHRVATSYSAFTLGIDSGTMTGGTIRVYGYRN
jgi:hypothetical protein